MVPLTLRCCGRDECDRHLSNRSYSARTMRHVILPIHVLAVTLMVQAPAVEGRWSEAACERLVSPAALARRRQLRPGERDQPARDVAGRHVRPADDRQGARLGGGPRHEHDARLPPRPALGAGRRRVPQADRPVPARSPRSTRSADVRAVRLASGIPIPQARQAARAEAGRAQLRLGAEPRREGARRTRRSTRASKPTSRAWSARSPRTTACSRGTSGTSRTT